MKNRLDILYISEYFPPYTKGGAEVSTSLIVEEISKVNRCIVLISKNKKSYWEFKNIKVFSLLKKCEISNNSFVNLIRYAVSILFNPLFNIKIIKRFLIKENPDIIHIIPTDFSLILPINYLMLYKKNIVVDFRDHFIFSPWGIDYIYDKRLKNSVIKPRSIYKMMKNKKNLLFRLLSLFSGVYEGFIFYLNRFILIKLSKSYNNITFVCPSNYVKNNLINIGFSKEKIKVIRNISKLYLNKRQFRENKIIFAGRIEKDKGIWDVIKAFELINNKNIIFEIAGKGSELDNIRSYLKKNKIKNIKLLGKISNEEVLRLYSKSKIIVAPSIIPEAFSRCILESISTRTPLITTSVGGNTEGIRDYETGLLVEPNNPKQLAKTIKKLLADKELYDKVVRNLEKEADKYSSERIGRQRMKVYEELINKQVK